MKRIEFFSFFFYILIIFQICIQSDLGERLMGAFNSRSSIPYSDVNLKDKSGRPPNWGPDSSLAEVATIQLEFNDLSHTLVNPLFQVFIYFYSIHMFTKVDISNCY